MSDVSEIFERIENMKGAYPDLTSGRLGATLIKSAAHAMTDPSPRQAEYSIAYRVMEAMIAGELVPKTKEG